jgi:subtilisin-like proprotein convertase family protein
MSKLTFTLTMVLAFCAAVLPAFGADITLSGQAPAMELNRDSKAGLDFHVEVGTVRTLEIGTKGGVFTRLLIPGFHTSMTEGSPELPMMNRMIAIPAGAEARVDVRNIVTRRVKLADYGVTAPVMPAQPSLSKSADPAQAPFVYDTRAYNKAEVRPELVRVVNEGRLRAMDLGRLEISPVSWFPATNELEIVESLDISVSFDGADDALQSDLIARTWSPFFEHLYAGVAGSKGFHDSYPDRVGDVVTMVVVTPPMFAGQMADFVQWKTERGFHTILAVTGTPEVGTTSAEIQAYLHGLYNNATPELPAPSFVLFVGDVAEMPTFTLNGDASDRPYCAVDADLVPDMYYGRFSATNPSELQAQLDKTMMYDQFTMPDPSYLDQVTLVAGVDATFAPTHGNGQINYGTTHYFNAAHGLGTNVYLYPESNGAVEAEIIQTVSDGVAMINYTAHGSETSWYDPAFSQANINSLTNSVKYTLAIGNCCLTSTYDYAECFGETWLRAADKGAIGYIGGSNSTYWDEDYWWGVGFHASSEIDGTAYPYEATGLGTYDGLFHDHGEAETLHYVTNDALIFAGNLAVMESGSSRIEYYWNIYNLLGDPSLSTYLAPQANPVSHPSTVFVGTPALTVGADVGSYVGLTQNGVLMGSGTVGVGGSLDITYLDALTPGVPMKMVVTAQNRVPYIVDLNVIVPATVTIDPMTIAVNTPTDITVTVLDADGVNPQPGIDVWAEGLGYSTAPVATDASGQAVISVNAAYGPTLDIVGQDPAETYRLFTEQVTVTAADLTAPDLTVSTDIGLSDSFALNLPGTLHATVAEAGHTLFAVLPDGSVLDTAAADLVLTPSALGEVLGIIAVSGYNVYSESFPIIEAYGSVAGTVTSGGVAMAGVTVSCLDGASNLVFSSVTDAAGAYASPEDVLVDDYTLVVDHFGYLHFEQAVFVNYGANTFDIDLTAAPSGVLSGTLVDAVSGDPLEGVVRVYRSDDGSLYQEVASGVDGAFATGALPYFTYNVQARAYHHRPVTLSMTIDEPSIVKDFALEPTNGDILVIDDGAKAGYNADKMGGKRGDELLAAGYEAPASKSAAEIALDLENFGYFVTTVAAASADPATFWDYDLVVLSCGANTSTLANAALKTGLVAFAQGGGHILLEGGELGYNQASSGDFATYVMHSNDWNADSAGTISVNDASAYILNNPNNAAVPLGLTYSGYGDSDAMAPLADAAFPLSWTGYASDASVITYDPNPAPEGGQIVFFCFNYLAADAAGRVPLLENAVEWLLALEIGDCSASGHALLAGQTDHSGITVSATPNGGQTVTAADGSFSFPGLYAGTYTIKAQKSGWGTVVQEITLADGENLTGLQLDLSPVNEAEGCKAPGAAINDNATITDVINLGQAGSVSAVEVYSNITHTWQGDLTLTLTSPAGTSVILHDRTGSSADNIIGWYPAELVPAGDLDLFVGEEMMGDWTLTVSDGAGGDTGVLNEWCLKITFAGGQSGVGPDGLPAVFALRGNYPNPFNPSTTISYDLPRAGHVQLQIYDVAGRLVRTLVDENRAAATHREVWDGRDNRGRGVASGVYYYRVTSGSHTATAKMMLLK